MTNFLVTNGDIFNFIVHAIVNPVNTVGVMGAGLAKQFADRYPQIIRPYRHACEAGLMTIGKVQWVNAGDKWIVNFPTKTHWKYKSHYQDIVLGLADLSRNPYLLDTIAIPALGCGLGGLDFAKVLPLIKAVLRYSSFDQVYIVVKGEK